MHQSPSPQTSPRIPASGPVPTNHPKIGTNHPPGCLAGSSKRSANVYVDLQTSTLPSLEQVFQRLAIPSDQRSQLLQTLRQRTTQGASQNRELSEDADLRGTGAEATALHLLGAKQGEKFEDHPLQPWAKEEANLQAALQPLTALEALHDNPRLVLLGDPGSGKSTLIDHLAYTLAGGLLNEYPLWQKTLENRFTHPLLPIRLVLRKWSARLSERSQPSVELVYQALADYCNQRERKALQARLEDPHTLLLFDGLDEVPTADESDGFDWRRVIVDSIDALRLEHPRCRLLVTCRVKPYEQGGYQLPDLPVFRLAQLDDARIQRFIPLWYDEMTRIEPHEEARYQNARRQLLEALPTRADLRQMAGTPLLLTMLARVNARDQLPENRAKLYHECVEQLLWEWERAKQETTIFEPSEGSESSQPKKAPDIFSPYANARSMIDLLRLVEPQRSRGDVELVLRDVTFAAHERSGKRTADLSAKLLEEKLAAIHPHKHEGKEWASRMIEMMKERGGLLVENEDGIFTFPHRSFQEYLAARWLLDQPDRYKQAYQLAGRDIWREVILLACGYRTMLGEHGEALSMINALMSPAPTERKGGDDKKTATSRKEESEAQCSRLLVAGQALLEFDLQRAAEHPLGHLPITQLPGMLTDLMQNARIPATQRLEAGLLAADLGDLPKDLDATVPIIATAKLGYDFAIGKYPVTNAQYKRFMEAGGYEQSKPWWDEQAIAEIKKWNGDWVEAPRLWSDRRFNHATQPVIAVSWYEANAYCRWLTEEWRKLKRIRPDQKVDLPSEAEWQWVYAGEEGRKYPWGPWFDQKKCNSSESELNQTSPVHMYPTGKTPEGVWDLAGNVWEWMNEGEERNRAYLRGCSYYENKENVSSAARDWNLRRIHWHFCGFRCVVVPVSR